MNEDFVPLELAKKLNEKGYCNHASYWDYTPTISQVLKWLREEKNIHITIDVDINDNFNFYFTILKKGRESWEVLQYGESCKTYEQAAFAGIEYVIDNML